ncbi:MAG: hypothetical protein ACI845_003695 [Gammaproteobacteria bacterium]|jgi:hypothetical protein
MEPLLSAFSGSVTDTELTEIMCTAARQRQFVYAFAQMELKIKEC